MGAAFPTGLRLHGIVLALSRPLACVNSLQLNSRHGGGYDNRKQTSTDGIMQVPSTFSFPSLRPLRQGGRKGEKEREREREKDVCRERERERDRETAT